ncbi:hypothetical protein PFUM301598_20850 [Pseudomonas fluorescens]
MRPSAPREEQVWELPSFSEAAIAVYQATPILTVPPPSQSRRGSIAPTGFGGVRYTADSRFTIGMHAKVNPDGE